MKLERRTIFQAALGLFLLYLCIHYWPQVSAAAAAFISAASPLLVGCVIAYAVNILMGFYERHFFPRSEKLFVTVCRRPVCMLAAFLTLAAIISLVVGLIVPQLVNCIRLIIDELPGAIDKLIDLLDRYHLLSQDVLSFLSSIDWQSRIVQIMDMLGSGLGSVMDIMVKTLTSVFSGVVTAFLSIIFSIYLLAGKDKLGAQASRLLSHYLPERWYTRVCYATDILNDCFRRYIIGQCTEAVILGLLCTLGMLIFGFPYPTMIGALIAFTALIPVAGAYIGAIVGAFLILMVSPIKALFFLIFLVILQQLEGNLIYPRVVGSSLGLPAIWVLAAVTVGGGLLGVVGMLLGVPLAATLYRLIKNDLNGVRAVDYKSAPAPAEKPPAEEEKPADV